MNNDLKIIKKKYGEKMMHLCRELFPTLLETPGLLSDEISKHFQPSSFLYDDLIQNNKIEEFKNYIYRFVVFEKENSVLTNKSPKVLLDEAGYILYECKTEKEIQSFKKYYAPGEELCTFRGERLNSCDVFFAVKKNIQSIRRENFRSPKREDEYGTSVISIQFSKGKLNTLSIKNRYNHRVNNPDNTFNNNLDNIIPGLNDSFAREYNYNFKVQESGFELPDYVNVNGKFYKYNYEINNIYYCPNNIIIDNFQVIDKYSNEPERYILFDYFIIDLKEKTIKLYENNKLKDGFIDEFKNIQNIVVLKDKETGNKTLQIIYDDGKEAIIIINNKNQIVEYHNNFQVEAKENFLYMNDSLVIVEMENLITLDDKCFQNAKSLRSFNAPKLTAISDYCFKLAESLKSFETPNLTKMGNYCFQRADKLTMFNAPSLIKMGRVCFQNADSLTILNIPYLTKMEECCFYNVNSLVNFNAPNLTSIGRESFHSVKSLRNFNVSNLTKMGDGCFSYVPSLTNIDVPNLTKMEKYCFSDANSLVSFNAPNLTKMGSECLEIVNSLTTFNALNLTRMGDICFYEANSLTTFNAPNLIEIGFSCFKHANSLTNFNAPNLTRMGDACFFETLLLTDFEAPNLIEMGDWCFLHINPFGRFKVPRTGKQDENMQLINIKKLQESEAPEVYKLIDLIRFFKYKIKNFKSNSKRDGGHIR